MFFEREFTFFALFFKVFLCELCVLRGKVVFAGGDMNSLPSLKKRPYFIEEDFLARYNLMQPLLQFDRRRRYNTGQNKNHKFKFI